MQIETFKSGKKTLKSSKVNVNVSIDKAELADIKAVTHIDKDTASANPSALALG